MTFYVRSEIVVAEMKGLACYIHENITQRDRQKPHSVKLVLSENLPRGNAFLMMFAIATPSMEF